MSALASLQSVFAAALRGEEMDDRLLRTRRDGGAPLLRIYRYAYAARLKDALQDNYPVLVHAMGDDAFAALAELYVEQTPSRTPSIRWYGHALADVMRRAGQLELHPALADLATMEWALRGAFDAPDSTVPDASTLASIAPEDWAALRFKLQPSARIVSLAWSVEPIYRALDGFEPDDERRDPQLPEPVAREHLLLVWRRGMQPCFRSLDQDEPTGLAAVARGECFADICASIADRIGEEQASARAVQWLQQWLTEDLIAGWAISPEAA